MDFFIFFLNVFGLFLLGHELGYRILYDNGFEFWKLSRLGPQFNHMLFKINFKIK